MPEITVEVNQSDITANVTSPNITANVTSADVAANVTTTDVTANVEAANVTVNITGGGSPHIIQDEGVAETQRANLNFVGTAVTVTDDSVNNATVVTITGGGGGGSGGGSASITDITYADMETALTGATLTEGQFYRITDATGTDLGFVCQAVRTDEITVNGTGGYLNADFQAVGDYSGTPETFGAQLGIWRTGFEAVTIAYLNLSGGTFAVGDTITGGTTGATAVIVTDDGASSMTAYMTSAGVAFDGSEVLDNGNGVTADQDGAATSPTIVLGDVVIWNLLHFQLTDDTAINGNNPEANATAYTQLLKTDAGQGYIEVWDVSEFNFTSNNIQYRKDKYNNIVIGISSAQAFPFGNGNVNNNFVLGGFIGINGYGDINRNTVYQGANINVNGGGSISECVLFSNSTIDITAPEDSGVVGCTLYASAVINEISIGAETTIENNILENGASLTGITAGANCSISGNKIEQGATFGNGTTMGDGASFSDNILPAGYRAGENTTLGAGAQIISNTNTEVTETTLGAGAAIRYNNGPAAFSLCVLGEGAFIAGCVGAYFSEVTLEDNAYFENVLFPASSLELVTLATGNHLFQCIFENTYISTDTISETFEFLVAKTGFSNIPGTIDITGLTTLDCTAAWAQYRGIYNLTSDNATEAIDTITNPPTLFPFTLRPAAGVVLTITGTAYSGIAAGQIALKATDYVLDGDKGEYIVLEIDPLGSGALIEKQVVNGLI